MADLRVSDLPALDAVDVEAVDPLLISDISASESKKIDVKSLVTAGVGLMEDGSINPGKISYPLPNDVVDGDAVIDNSLPGDKIEDGSIEKAKIASRLSGDHLNGSYFVGFAFDLLGFSSGCSLDSNKDLQT